MSTRQDLAEEMESTLRAFHQLLHSIPPEALGRPTRNPAWTVRQVLYHMSLAPRFLIADVLMITRHRWLSSLIQAMVPRSVFNWINVAYTRIRARNASLSRLQQEYEKAHQVALRALALVSDDDLQRSLPYPDWDPNLSGDVTVERLFHYVRDHFEAHAAELRDHVGSEEGTASLTQ